MASSTTLKSQQHHQPLHNFPLQDLKWSMNHHHNHRIRNSNHNHTNSSSSLKSPNREPTVATDSDEKSDKSKFENSDKKSKIFLRIKTKTHSNNDSADAMDQDHDQTSSSLAVADDAEETLIKTWNLRPRKPVSKSLSTNNGGGGVSKIGVGGTHEIKTQEHPLSRSELTRPQRNGNGNDDNNSNNNNNNNNSKKEKVKKVKFSIPLAKQEIEEDVYALTGSKPARRPKKRAKHVQKQLDCLFPGLWLASVTPDAYRVDAPLKG